jgi:Zn-dependent protease
VDQQIELFRIAGIPVYLDLLFILMLLIVMGPVYFVGGDSQFMSVGIVVIIGLIISILLHELGHAFAARYFGIGVRHIELNALGGLAQFERSLPDSVFIKTVIFLAGPAVNIALYYGFDWLAGAMANPTSQMLIMALLTLSSYNLYLAIFNLLPAFPLDGGQTLNAWLDRPLGAQRSIKIVAGLGLMIAVYFAVTALPSNFWRLVLAFFLFQTNWLAWQSTGRWK